MGLSLAMLWFSVREPVGLPLRYGELKELLGLPGVTLHDVKVSRSEIRGTISTQDRISGTVPLEGTESVQPPGPVTKLNFRTARQGVFEVDTR
jgi:hypothetical protein